MNSQHTAWRAQRVQGTAAPPSVPELSNTERLQLAKLAARFITHRFACPDYPAPRYRNQVDFRLPFFIDRILYQAKMHSSVTYAALVLLQRLKARFPSSRGTSGHWLFISAYMISSKAMYDEAYTNKTWSIVVQGMFSLRRLNQMEREMCNYLDWELNVDDPILTKFARTVNRDFGVDRPWYPYYSATDVSMRAVRYVASQIVTPIPGLSDDNDGPAPNVQPRSLGTQTRSSRGAGPSYPSTSSGFPTAPGHGRHINRGAPVQHGPRRTTRRVNRANYSPEFGTREGIPAVHPLKDHMVSASVPSGW
ncbi:hypothetical protein M413DRAFT_29842 [Hebeloma cylindrosporum]|uniref:Cyclin N-terminal domain-containing protein n=1 Tax=Hebeloma cylindrosporum TaxID=76867 RepID=A0A0C2XMG8_HEBCY|nr:hypothetical protein M413DRAFT_29842 [Hebeloma cylindrosporum h7]